MSDLSKLKPGKQLDAMIEQMIFNRVPCDAWKQEYGGWGMAVTGGGPIFRKGECDHEACYPTNSPPQRSTRIEAAWEILDKFIDVEIEKSGDDWSCLIYSSVMERATKQSAPYAICIAALKTIEGGE